MKGDQIADPTHKLTRYARAGLVDRKPNGDIYVTGAAFKWTKSGDHVLGLSVNWLHYFAGTQTEQLKAVRAAMHMTASASARLALLEVGRTTDVLGDRANLAISVVQDPSPADHRYPNEDPSHAAIAGLPDAGVDDQQSDLVGDLIAKYCVLENVPARESRPAKP